MESIACNECRTRKLRCSKDRPNCTYCVKHQVACVYNAKIFRSPITRAKLISLEHRAKCLENALLALNPEADFDAIISSLPTDKGTPRPPSSPMTTKEPIKERSEGQSSTEIPEELPSTSSGFDWHEGTSPEARSADGMATLSFSPNGVGYIGNLAAAALLRVLRRTGAKLDSVGEQTHEPVESNMDPRADVLTQGYMTDQFISAYFQHFHTSYPLLHEATFRAQASEIIPKPDVASWQILYKTVLATGAWCMGFPIPDGGTQALLSSADAIPNSNLLGSGSLSIVQSFTLMSLHLQKLNRPNIAYVYHGAAVRMAISLGLHREFPAWKISPHDREVRRRLWWCLYLFDSGQSITLGRPILLPTRRMIDIQIPLNIHDAMLTMATSEHPTAVVEPTIYSHIIAQTGFQLIFNPIYDRLISRGSINPGEALQFDAEISEWESSLPSFFKESIQPIFYYPWVTSCRYRLNWRVRSLRMLIFFPTFLRWARPNKGTELDGATQNEQSGILKCLDYARQNVSSIQNYFLYESSDVLGEWYALYFLSQAGLISILAAMWSPAALTEQHTSVIADIKIIKQLLGSMAVRSEQAREFSNVMERLMPNSSLENESLNCAFEGSEYDEMLLSSYSEVSYTQADELARFFWPAPS